MVLWHTHDGNSLKAFLVGYI